MKIYFNLVRLMIVIDSLNYAPSKLPCYFTQFLCVSLRSGYKFFQQICPFIERKNLPYFPSGKALQEKLPIWCSNP